MSLDDAPPPGLLHDDPPRTALAADSVAAQSGWVRAVARNLVRDPWGAEDVAQETLLAALAAPPRDVPDDSHLRAWLGRVAYNLSRLDLRSGGRRRAREKVVARCEALPSASEELEAVAARGELLRALRLVDEASRHVLQLRYFEGLTTAAIARRLGLSELAVRKRLWRARQKLRHVLEPRRRGFQAWIGLLGWRSFARLEVAGLAAAGAAALLALDLESERGQPPSSLQPLVNQPAALTADSGTASEESGVASAAPRRSGPAREHRPPSPPPPRPGEGVRDELRPLDEAVRRVGLVLDLEGSPRAGLAIVTRDAPTEPLAWSDALGGFGFAARGELELCAVGEGLVTLVPARSAPEGAEALVLVAPGAPFTASVRAADGQPLDGAEVELLARETAFVRIERPVTLASPVLALARPTAEGELAFDALARGRGLFVRVRCAGFEPLERSTLELGDSAAFVLEREAEGPVLTGCVSLLGGLPARGARVRLALAETVTDERGGFRLPLRGAGPHACLEVQKKGYAPEIERDILRRLERGVLKDGIEVVLDRPLDPVHGELTGPVESFASWRVFAFPAGVEGAPYEARCAGDGSFELELPRGSAELFAVSPESLDSHAGFLGDTRDGAVELAVLPRASQDERLALRADDGSVLAGAAVELELILEGERKLPWGTLACDGSGILSYRRAHGAEVALRVRHDELGPEAVETGLAPELFLARARAVRIEGAQRLLRRGRVLDGAGAVLALNGPLGSAEEFALEEGQSAMTFVPPTAHWVELLGDGSTLRIPIEAVPGERETLVP